MADLASEHRLSRGASRLLAAFRDHETPAMVVAQRTWRAVCERTAHPDVAARESWALRLPTAGGGYGEPDVDEFEGAAPIPAFPGAFHYAKSVGASVAIAAAVLLSVRVVVTSASTMTQRASGDALAAPYQGAVQPDGGKASVKQPAVEPSPPQRTTRPVKAPVAEVVAEVAPSPAPAIETPAAPPGRSHRARPAKAKAATQVDEIAAELQLVQDATRAKNAGDTSKALALLGEHGERFPSGALAQERQVLRAEVLCARGDKAGARRLAERFAARHSTSALLGRMNGVCAD